MDDTAICHFCGFDSVSANPTDACGQLELLTVTKHKTKESTNQSDVRPTIFKSGPGWGSLRGRAGSRLGARPLIYTSTKIFEKIFHMIIFFNKVLDN